MNNDHSDANLAYVKGLSELHNATSAKLIDVDQLGITLLAETSRWMVRRAITIPETTPES